MVGRDVCQHQGDHRGVGFAASRVAAFTSNLASHRTPSRTYPSRSSANASRCATCRTNPDPPVCSCAGRSPWSCPAGGSTRRFLAGRPGCCSATWSCSGLSEFHAISLVDVLWGDNPPAAASAALNALISKVRAAVGPEVLRGRAELSVALPEPAHVDVEAATFGAARGRVRCCPAGLAAGVVARRRPRCLWHADRSYPRPTRRGPSRGAVASPICTRVPWNATRRRASS